MKRLVLGLMLCVSLIAVAYGSDVSMAFDTQGRLWRASVKQGQVWVDHSQPLKPGETPEFSGAVAVTTATQKLGALAIDDDGKIWVASMDASAAIYLTVSGDRGASFSVARKVADSKSACSSIAIQPAPNNQVVALWQQSFGGGVRDYAIARFDMQSPVTMHRATFGGLHMNTCPQIPPTLARGGDWGWHMAWADGGEKAGVFYARMDGEAWVSSPAKHFGGKQAQTAQPSLLAIGEHVWLAWKAADEQGATIHVAMSDDGGRSWVSPTVVAQTQGAADDPILLGRGEQAYLSWNTAAGYRFSGLQQ
ncbi:MAG TPA: hypothetical protein VIE69_00500 [Methylophilaceae bacterium]